MKPTARCALAFSLAAIAACRGERETPKQWIVEVSTDAPVPQFGDRLLFELVTEDGLLACDACRYQVGVDAASSWPVSFGIAWEAQALYLRVRFFRSATAAPDGSPQGAALIDHVSRLPPFASDRETVAVRLSMDCFGVPSRPSPFQSCDPATSTLAAVTTTPFADQAPPWKVGAWPPAGHTPCPEAPPDGMVCVPGGAFLLGSPLYYHTYDESNESPEHLVTLKPFAIDRDEVTVGTVWSLVDAGLTEAPSLTKEQNADQLCVYDGDDPTLPMNCLTYQEAQRFCEAMGKRLPTEAEWEYVAGNLEAETTWPWGDDDNVCAYANVARGRFQYEFEMPAGDEIMPYEETSCRLQHSKEYGPQAFDAGLTDITRLGVRNLAGSVAEIVADEFDSYTAPCWSVPASSSYLANPRCGDSSTHPGSSFFRGGSWGWMVYSSRVTVRSPSTFGIRGQHVGFRCAR